VCKKLEPVAIDVYELFDFVCCESGAKRLATWIGEKLLTRGLIDVNLREKNFEP
jgi:hypothetical protein